MQQQAPGHVDRAGVAMAWLGGIAQGHALLSFMLVEQCLYSIIDTISSTFYFTFSEPIHLIRCQ
jgi:hypothetical protein